MDTDPRKGRQFSANDQLPFVAAPGGEEPVELASLDIRVVVTGLYAETTQTMRFYNPNRRDLEGNLSFPLPDRAVVCGYALDIDGALVDGVVVPKHEARRILEAEERKGIDPGLVEQVQGNVYRTRIYPMPAGGSRTIRLVYISDLSVDGNDAAYHLPLAHASNVEQVSLRVEVVQAPVTPTLKGGLGNLSLERWDERWVAEAKLGRGTPAEDLQVRLPALPDNVSVVETFDGETFFSVSRRVPDEADEPRVPKRIGLLWDASGSRGDASRDIRMLEALLEAWPRVTVDVRVVRDVVEAETRTFRTADEQAGELVAYLEALPRDGGTRLSAIQLGDLPHQDVEAWLLFSDGMNTIGSGLPEGSAPPLFAISSQARCDGAYLEHLASRTGGRYLNLLRMSPEAAAGAASGWRESLRLERAAGCEDVHVSTRQGRFTVMGRLVETIGSVALSGPGAPADHVAVTASAAKPGRAIARAWAGQQAQSLALLGERTGAEVVALGQRYGLVTPGTSLLVLETLEQYLEYDIEPPETWQTMYAQFHEHRLRDQSEKDEERREHIEEVVELWQERVRWWQKDFHAERAKKKRKPKKRDEGGDARLRGIEMPAVMAPPAAAPMRTMAFAMEDAAMAAEPMAAAGAPMVEAMDMDYMAEEHTGGAADKKGAPARAEASIRIKPWSPDTPYLTAMKRGDVAVAYEAYLEQRPDYAESPAFFFDCADYLLSSGEHALGLRVLSNIVELAIGDAAMLRMYAWRLQQAGELDAAIEVFERVLRDREDEPQSHRDLALALGLRWERDGAEADAARAMELLYAVVSREWDRFPEIELIALMELNRLADRAGRAGIEPPAAVDERLVKLLDLDLRISMSWDADLTDVDLHVFEPTGEHAYYGHNLTEIGGLVSRDFREGYGPEEYVLRRAEPGTYTIKAHYYGSHQQQLTGACTVIVNVFTNYGRPDEQRQVLTLRLEQASDQVLVGEVDVAGSSAAHAEVSDDPQWQTVFRSLRRGMTIDEITAVVGQPDEVRGGGETILVYRPVDEVEIHVVTAPALTAVLQIMDGATLELI